MVAAAAAAGAAAAPVVAGLTPEMLGLMMAASGAASLFGQMFQKNPADIANKYLDQVPGQMEQYYNPYMQMGQAAGAQTMGQYGQLMSDPGARMNEIGAGYESSPGYDFRVDQAMQAGNNAMAAGGMAGSPMHQQQSMQMAGDMAGEDYYKWLMPTLNEYNTGLAGGQKMYDTGFDATNQLAQSIMDTLFAQADVGYKSAIEKNKGIMGSLGQLGAGMSSFFF